jgi:hypothetical protein
LSYHASPLSYHASPLSYHASPLSYHASPIVPLLPIILKLIMFYLRTSSVTDSNSEDSSVDLQNDKVTM